VPPTEEACDSSPSTNAGASTAESLRRRGDCHEKVVQTTATQWCKLRADADATLAPLRHVRTPEQSHSRLSRALLRARRQPLPHPATIVVSAPRGPSECFGELLKLHLIGVALSRVASAVLTPREAMAKRVRRRGLAVD
jgi:hypothetical protein